MLDYRRCITCPPAKKEDFRLINQKALKRCHIPESDTHNAIWDLHISSDGTVYFPLSAEMHFSENVWLYTYDYKSNTVKRLFKLEDKVFCRENAIHASKIHTSLCEMSDGRIIMSTHTTSQSPLHPTWLPESYYAHQWEGFEGSNILIYDPKTGNVENRGKPVPYESIYGGRYSPRDNAFYFTGYLRGHLYRLDIDTNQVHDYGQTSEFGSFRVVLGPDGNIYTASRSGIFYKIDTTTHELIDTGHRFPKNTDIVQGVNHSQLDYCVAHGTKMYMAVVFLSKPAFLVYDTENNTMSMTDTYIPEGANVGAASSVHGMDFDSENVLWYTIKKFDPTLQGIGHLLCSWDIFGGGKPILYGLVGTDVRTNMECAELEIYDDILYVPDSNYFFHDSAMMGIDLKYLKAHPEKGPYSPDPAVYSYVENCKELYDGDYEKDIQPLLVFLEECDRAFGFVVPNNFAVDALPKVTRTWQSMPIFESSVVDICYENGLIKAVCGNNEYREISIKDGDVTDVKTVDYKSRENEIPKELIGLDYPCVPGRQYKAEPDICAKLWDGRYIVATKDGLVCVVDGQDVISYGSAIQTCAPVNGFAVSNTRKEVYGIAGGYNDCGILFRYDDKRGLRQLGRTYFNRFMKPGVASSNEPACIALSEDETHIAIGAKDQLGCIYEYVLDEIK